MKSLNTLIKINTRELDDLRKLIKQCEEEMENLITTNNKLEDELIKEQNIALQDHDMAQMFISYKQMVKNKQANIIKSLQNLEKRREALKESITIKFGEVKKFEILLANHIEKARKKELAKETIQFDEISINNFLKENAEN